ncbi:hypothetical protein ACE939_05355 [Aquimarina sp. W85]|uniref:hypothetical protein n=1 Tax=Aquimarina rhodophyticola TaxID=3342246 RepID=UPI00366E361F
MKNSLKRIKGLKKIDKTSQAMLIGGGRQFNNCVSDCYSLYFADSSSNACAVPDNNGGVCYGTVQNNQCCI